MRSGAPSSSLAASAPSASSARISSRSMPSASRPLPQLRQQALDRPIQPLLIQVQRARAISATGTASSNRIFRISRSSGGSSAWRALSGGGSTRLARKLCSTREHVRVGRWPVLLSTCLRVDPPARADVSVHVAFSLFAKGLQGFSRASRRENSPGAFRQPGREFQPSRDDQPLDQNSRRAHAARRCARPPLAPTAGCGNPKTDAG